MTVQAYHDGIDTDLRCTALKSHVGWLYVEITTQSWFCKAARGRMLKVGCTFLAKENVFHECTSTTPSSELSGTRKLRTSMASSPEGLLLQSRRPSSRWTWLNSAAFQQSKTEAQPTTSRSNTGAIQMNSPPRSLGRYLRCVCIVWPRLRWQHDLQGYELSTVGVWPGLSVAIGTTACTRTVNGTAFQSVDLSSKLINALRIF